MATVPLSGTNIRLLSSVPFSNDYKNTRWFDTLSQQTNYFLNKPVVHSESEMNFQRIEGSPYISINKSIDELWGTNYVMFQNAHYNNKWFYGFVTRLEYKQRNTTWVHFQIDVFQTWKFEINFKPSYVVREHRPLWNSDGTPVINTIDEGLNYGTEYDNVWTYQYTPNGGYKWLVIVSKSMLHTETNTIKPRVIGTPQPLSYYIVPFRDDDVTPIVYLKDGSEALLRQPTSLLETLYTSENAVNNIVSLYVTDYTGIPTTYTPNAQGGIITFPNNSNEIVEVSIDTANVLYVQKVVEFSSLYEQIFSDKYSHYEKGKESKLLMYPYCLTVIDDFKGNRTIYKNEYLSGNSFYINMKGSLGTSNKVSINVPDYNHSQSDGQRGETSNESALINNNPSDIPIINDMLSAFLQGNRNSLENQKDSIVWNGVMGAIGDGIGATVSARSGNPVGVASSGVGMAQGVGNSVLQIQGIQAKQKDIQNVPPQMVKMGSNTSYDYGNGYNGVWIMKKQIKPEYRKILSDFFNMFGYKTNEVKVPNFHTRRYWNYVQTTNCNIIGNFNNEDLQELKSIFDNGITLWHTDDVGNYDLDNEVIA